MLKRSLLSLKAYHEKSVISLILHKEITLKKVIRIFVFFGENGESFFMTDGPAIRSYSKPFS